MNNTGMTGGQICVNVQAYNYKPTAQMLQKKHCVPSALSFWRASVLLCRYCTTHKPDRLQQISCCNCLTDTAQAVRIRHCPVHTVSSSQLDLCQGSNCSIKPVGLLNMHNAK